MLHRDVDLSTSNTLALPGRARLYARIDYPGLLLAPELRHQPRFILGGGSNLVLTGDFDGLVIHMAIGGRRLVAEDAEAWYVEAGAGENWASFVAWTLDQGWPGLENLSLIPGTVGAAPIQNIGAYGLEIADRFHGLAAHDFDTGRQVTFNREACHFGYRDSIFKQEGWHRTGRYAITAVTFRLPKQWTALTGYGELALELETAGVASPTPQDMATAVIATRCRKLPDPAVLPNAGSFFQNPVVDAATAGSLLCHYPGLPTYPMADGRVKLAAGWLIEQAGWKGRHLGPMGLYDRQALVLVNHGGGNGDDINRIMAAVQEDIHSLFGIELVPEPIFL